MYGFLRLRSGLRTDRLVENADWEQTELMNFFCLADNYGFSRALFCYGSDTIENKPIIMDTDTEWSHNFRNFGTDQPMIRPYATLLVSPSCRSNFYAWAIGFYSRLHKLLQQLTHSVIGYHHQ